MASELHIQGVRKCFGKGDKAVEVLKKIDIDVAPGEFLILVGPSGCGKSTLLSIIAGLEEPTEGAIRIAGRDVVGVPPAQRDIAMVFQSYALYPHKTVYDNMAFGLKIAKVPKAEIDRRVREASEILQITEYLQRLPKALSGGQRQRVAIGRAIVRNPKVFLFDEPLSNLDAALRTKMRVELATLHRRLGATMVYVTHDQVEAMTLADKIVVLNKGRIEQVGAPLELYHRPATRFVASFIGSPQMNFIDGSYAEQFDAHAVGIRPEHLRIDASGQLEGTLRHAEQLGNETFAYVDAGPQGDLTARIDGSISVEPGERLRLGHQPEHLYRFDAAGLRI